MWIDSLIIILLLGVLGMLFVLMRRQHQTGERLDALQGQFEQSLHHEVRGLFGQLEAYLSLRDRLDLRQGLPYTHLWSASPDFLKLIVEHCLAQRPAHIVECSSGLTTLMLARCCELNGRGQVTSLENGAEYADRTRAEIARYALGAQATVLHAPLEPVSVNTRQFEWYSLAQLPEGPIDMLVIDGPPGFIQQHSRYPALPLLYERLANGCVVFLDDAAREDEQAIVAQWQHEFPGLEHRYINTERGCSVLRIVKPTA